MKAAICELCSSEYIPTRMCWNCLCRVHGVAGGAAGHANNQPVIAPDGRPSAIPPITAGREHREGRRLTDRKIELVLCIPMLQRAGMHPNTFYSLWTMRHSLPEKDRLVSFFPMDRPQASARSDAFRVARELDADALLFIDSDMEFQPDLYSRLLAVDADIACGLFWTKRIPSYPTVCVKTKRPEDGSDSLSPIVPNGKIQEIDACGMAATLIRRPVLQSERFPYPAFKHLGSIGEDYFFCLHARDAGFKIKCDTSLRVAHRGDVAFNGQPILTHPDLKTLSYPFGGEDGVEQAV